MEASQNNRGKIIIFSVIGVCILLMIIVVLYFFSNASKSNDEENKPPILSSQDNLTVKDMIDINGDNTNDYRGHKKADSIQDNTAKYNSQIENIYGVGKSAPKSNYYEESTPKISTLKNSHNVYGDYSMWENKEPSNSRIGYSSKKRNSEQNEVSEREKPEKVTEPIYNISTPTYSIPIEKKHSQIAQTKSKLISQGYAANNKSISFVILENFTLNGEQISKGKSYAVGTIKMENNRLFVRINSIKANGKVYSVMGKVIGYDGDDGLPIYDEENTGVAGSGIVRDEAINQVGRIPIVGGIIRRVSNTGNSRVNVDKIALSDNIECQVVIYN